MNLIELLHRTKTIDVRSAPEGTFIITARFCDEDHDADVTLTVAEPRRIVSAQASFRRAPYGERCLAVTERIGRLVGIAVKPGCSRAVYRAVGGPAGCTHLVEMVMDALRACLPAYGRGEMLRVAADCRKAGMSEEEAQRRGLEHIHQLGRRFLADTCVIYRRGGGRALPRVEQGRAQGPAGKEDPK